MALGVITGAELITFCIPLSVKVLGVFPGRADPPATTGRNVSWGRADTESHPRAVQAAGFQQGLHFGRGALEGKRC